MKNVLTDYENGWILSDLKAKAGPRKRTCIHDEVMAYKKPLEEKYETYFEE